MPTEVSRHVGFFDRFASRTAGVAPRAWLFAACLILVLVWRPSIIWFDVDTWQLIINTVTTIITFRLVALLQNTQTRADAAVQHKLNAITEDLSSAQTLQIVEAVADAAEVTPAVAVAVGERGGIDGVDQRVAVPRRTHHPPASPPC
jgi:low affinity Fe/Cu permease